MEDPEHERRAIEEYFLGQSPEGDEIHRSEKVKTETIASGRRFDVWELQASSGKWWVITNLTNLYWQDDFPSLDHVFSFHIGLMERMLARQQRAPNVPQEQEDRLSATWRKFSQAAVELDEAEEAEEFQAIGMRCREVLLQFVREVAKRGKIDQGQDPPVAGDFVNWSEVIADSVAPGAGSKAVRSHLKKLGLSTWTLVSWLTHAQNATFLDAEIALISTHEVLDIYSLALVRYERGAPDKCPDCGSYRVVSDYRSSIDSYVTLCATCGWEDSAEPSEAGEGLGG